MVGLSNVSGPYVSYVSPEAVGRPKGCFGRREGDTITAYNPWAPKEYTESPKEEAKVTQTEVMRKDSDEIFINLKLSNGADIRIFSSAMLGVLISEEWVDRSNPLSLSNSMPNKYGSWHINGKGGSVTLLEPVFKSDCSDIEFINSTDQSTDQLNEDGSHSFYIDLPYENEAHSFLSSSIAPGEQRTIDELEAIYRFLPEDSIAKDDMKVVIERAKTVATSGWGNNIWRKIAGF